VAIDETEEFIIVQALHPKKFALKNAEQALSDPLVKQTVHTELNTLITRQYERMLQPHIPHERPGNVRNEVWEMCRIMHSHEKNLLSKAIHTLAV
jgi:hypothetical protein